MELKQNGSEALTDQEELKENEADALNADGIVDTDYPEMQLAENEFEESQNEEESEESEQETEDQKPSEDDYLDELSRLREERDNYKKGLLSLKKKFKEDDNSEDYRETVKSEIENFKREMTKDTFETLLEAISENDSEKDLIRFHYENSIKQQGFDKKAIQNDLETSKLLANRNKIARENSELKLSLKNKSQITNSGVGSSRNEKSETVINLSPIEKRLLERTNNLRQVRGLKPLTTREFMIKN